MQSFQFLCLAFKPLPKCDLNQIVGLDSSLYNNAIIMLTDFIMASTVDYVTFNDYKVLRRCAHYCKWRLFYRQMYVDNQNQRRGEGVAHILID